jgi:hypothetical protein
MRFTALDCDPDSGEPDGGDGTEDVFPLEAFEVRWSWWGGVGVGN